MTSNKCFKYEGLSKVTWTFLITITVQANIFKFQLTINLFKSTESILKVWLIKTVLLPVSDGFT